MATITIPIKTGLDDAYVYVVQYNIYWFYSAGKRLDQEMRVWYFEEYLFLEDHI